MRGRLRVRVREREWVRLRRLEGRERSRRGVESRGTAPWRRGPCASRARLPWSVPSLQGLACRGGVRRVARGPTPSQEGPTTRRWRGAARARERGCEWQRRGWPGLGYGAWRVSGGGGEPRSVPPRRPASSPSCPQPPPGLSLRVGLHCLYSALDPPHQVPGPPRVPSTHSSFLITHSSLATSPATRFQLGQARQAHQRASHSSHPPTTPRRRRARRPSWPRLSASPRTDPRPSRGRSPNCAKSSTCATCASGPSPRSASPTSRSASAPPLSSSPSSRSSSSRSSGSTRPSRATSPRPRSPSATRSSTLSALPPPPPCSTPAGSSRSTRAACGSGGTSRRARPSSSACSVRPPSSSLLPPPPPPLPD